LLDALAEVGIQPDELWADRGYASRAHEEALNEPDPIADQPTTPSRRPDPYPGNADARSGAARNAASKPVTHKHATAGPSNAPTPG